MRKILITTMIAMLVLWAGAQALHLAAELKLSRKDAAGAAAIYPWDYKYSMILGTSNILRGNLSGAIRRFEDVLSRAPRHIAAANNLAVAYTMKGRPPDKLRAERILIGALKIAPMDPLVRYNLAIVRGQRPGKYELAMVES